MRYSYFVIMGLCACTLTESRFGTAAPNVYCGAYKACDLDAFLARWPDGTPACRQEATLLIKERKLGLQSASCRYQQDKAGICMQQLGSDNCDILMFPDYLEDCIHPAWDCIAIVP